MRIYVTVKAAGKRRSWLEKQELLLEEAPATLLDLIGALVRRNVAELNRKETDAPLVPYLTNRAIDQQAAVGKIGFGAKHNAAQADPEEAVETAVQAYKDGLFRVFVCETEVEGLDSALQLEDGDPVTMIKFTMLAGRMW